jgi:hypothetical protein
VQQGQTNVATETKLSHGFGGRNFSSQQLNFSTPQLFPRQPAVGWSDWLGTFSRFQMGQLAKE